MDNQMLLADAATGFISGFIVFYAVRYNRGLIRVGALLAAGLVFYIAALQGVPGLVDQAGSLLSYLEEYAVFFRGAVVGQMVAMVVPNPQGGPAHKPAWLKVASKGLGRKSGGRGQRHANGRSRRVANSKHRPRSGSNSARRLPRGRARRGTRG